MTIHYLDNNATTAVAPEVRDAILPFLDTQYFNPSSMYEPAQSIKEELDKARSAIANQFGPLGPVSPKEFLFTSCASESNNAAIFGAIQANPNRRHIITTAVEHPAVLEVCREAERRGCRITYLPVDRHGNINVIDFVQALDDDVLLISIMHANNESGVVFPIDQLSRIAKETDPAIIFHTDATQSVTKLPIDLSDNFRYVDMLSFSGHKLHAPKGVGALYVRRGTRVRPFLIGGHQENGRRAGTENVAFIVGMARAMTLATETGEEDEARILRLRDKLEQGLLQSIPYSEVNGQDSVRLPNTLNIAVHYVEGEGMLYGLDAEGICASSGSACTSGSLEPSHVLRAMGVPFTAVHGSIRFSLSRYTTDAEIDHVLAVFPKIVESLRRMSPYWDVEKGEPRPDIETMFE
jgi:cysteine desulfurase